MVEQRHSSDRLQVAWFTHESTYGDPESTWDATTAALLTDLDNAAPHERIDDQLSGTDLVRQGHQAATEQAIASQSVRIPFASPRAVPNTIAGTLGVTLGAVQTTQQGFAPAYRHRITPGALDALPSITALLQHQDGDSWRYSGCKGESWLLRNDGAMLRVECPLVGSGFREQVIADWAPLVYEKWLLWGDCEVYMRDLSSTPLTLPTNPVQGATNLGEGTLTWSPRILNLQVSCRNSLALDDYTVTSGLVRNQLHVMRREITVTLQLDVNLADPLTSDEAVLLNWYFEQRPFAIEWQCTGEVIFPTTVTDVGTIGAVALHIQDETLGDWYITISIFGNLIVSDIPPGVGTIVETGFGPILRGESGLNYQMTVVVLDGDPNLVHTELGDPPDYSVLEYFTLQDALVQTWYLWYAGPPGDAHLVRDTTAPVAGGDYRWGFIVLLPHVQFRPFVRGETGNFDSLEFVGTALEFGSDPAIVTWTFNRTPAYLA